MCVSSTVCGKKKERTRAIMGYLSTGHDRPQSLTENIGPWYCRALSNSPLGAISVMYMDWLHHLLTRSAWLILTDGQRMWEGVRSVYGPALITVFRRCSMSCLRRWEETRARSCCSVARDEPRCTAASLRRHVNTDEPGFDSEDVTKTCSSITSTWQCESSSFISVCSSHNHSS